MSLNKAMLIGNVGRDPEVRYLDGNSGNAKVATFTLATTERYRDRNGETRENTEWHNIVAWRSTADVVERFVKKGTQLYIEGRIRTRSWDDQSGNKRYTTEIIADNLQLLGRKSDNPGSQPGGYQTQSYRQPASVQNPAQVPPVQASAPANLTTQHVVDDIPDDDLPF
ncbi:MAG: single-stranded DNA-binding protein [Bacteroidales bacterium]|nr:single-stranded DNA-binding protein [Bacteroidales bacterium]